MLPLAHCIDKVREYAGDAVNRAEEELKQAEEYKAKGDMNMYGYCLSCVTKVYQQQFSFEANVFNTDTYDFSIPKELDGFWAVVVDMHN